MKPIKNYENVQPSTGEFARLIPDGYVCEIKKVTNVPMDKNGKGDYLKIEFDIAYGSLSGYYQDQFDRWGGNWNGSFIRSYKEKALGMFKHFTNCIELSNEYVWDWNEEGLVGKQIGLVLGEEEYVNSSGEVKTKLSVRSVKTVNQIMEGDFTIPKLKELKPEEKERFIPLNDVLDDDIPF